jgi:hypothetical protein
MTASCPHCGGALDAPVAHRGELERQLGDPARAAMLRTWAQACPGVPERWGDFIAWRGYVWAKVRVRKGACCCVTLAEIPPGAWAWRQLSEVRDRDLRVSVEAWAHL